MSAQKRIANELKALRESPPAGCISVPDEIPAGEIFEWQVTIKGPPQTPYDGKEFVLNLKFPSNYPFAPVSVHFVTEIDHPVALPDGTVTLGMLSTNGWHPAVMTKHVLQELLDTLGPQIPLNEDDETGATYIFRNGTGELMGRCDEVEVKLVPTDTIAVIREKVARKVVSEGLSPQDKSYHQWRVLICQEGGSVSEMTGRPSTMLRDLGDMPTSGHRFIPKASSMPLR